MSSSRAGWRSAAFLAATRSSHGDWAPLRAEPTTSACACASDHRSPRRRPPVLQPRPRHSRIRVCLQRPWSPPSTGCLASVRAVMLASQSSILVGPSVVRFARQCFRAQGGSRELNRLPLTCSCPAPAPLADRSTARGSRLCSQIAALLAPQTRLVAPEACRARRLPFKPRLLLSRGQAILAVDAMIYSSSSAHPTAPGLAEMAPGSALRLPPLSLSLARPLPPCEHLGPSAKQPLQSTHDTDQQRECILSSGDISSPSFRSSKQSILDSSQTVRDSQRRSDGQTITGGPRSYAAARNRSLRACLLQLATRDYGGETR